MATMENYRRLYPDAIHPIPPMITVQNRYLLTKSLSLSFEKQLMIGCGHETCTKPSCWTYRRRTNRKPLRKPSRDTARATALVLAEQPDAVLKLCCFVIPDENQSAHEPDASNETTESPPGKQQVDPKSINQNSVNTNIMKNVFDICASEESTNNVALQMFNTSLRQKSRLGSWSDLVPTMYSGMTFWLTKRLIPPEEDRIDRKELVHVAFHLFRDPFRLFRSFKDAYTLDLVESVFVNSDPKLEFVSSDARYWERNARAPHLDPCRLLDILKLWVEQLGQLVLEGLSEALDQIDENLTSLVESGKSWDVMHVFFICIYALQAYCGSTVDNAARCRYRVLNLQLAMNNQLAYNFARKILRFLDLEPQDTDKTLTPYQGALATIFYEYIYQQNVDIVDSFGPEVLSPLIVLVDCASIVIHREWDRKSIIQNASAVGKSLKAIGILGQLSDPRYQRFFQEDTDRAHFIDLRSMCDQYNDKHSGYWSQRLLPDFLQSQQRSLMKVAEEFWNVPNEHFSILTVFDVFNPILRIRLFRATCFYRMQKVRDKARYYRSLITRNLRVQSEDSEHIADLLERLPTTESGQGLRSVVENCLTMSIRRESPLEDALNELWRLERRKLHRPLKVHMDTEVEFAADYGGVSQEFLRLAVKEMFRPDYGIMIVNPESQTAWFDPKSLEPLYKYELSGLLLGLAVYNGFTLPVNFPGFLYRKLCKLETVNERAYLSCIADGWPDLHRAFEELLDSDDEVSNTIMRTYVFSFETIDGRSADVDMTRVDYDQWSARNAAVSSVNTSESAPLVTNKNRREYVDDYIFWLTDMSIRPQYLAFEKGFKTLITQDQLRIVSPTDLQTILEGSKTNNIYQLERITTYDGYDRDDPVITWFWEIFREFDEVKKKAFLIFVTAAERLPPGGIDRLELCIKRVSDLDRLVTAHTCFNVLYLPPYESKEKLQEVLDLALENNEGFGFA
ncbi:MAG: hypothetical protein M1831_004074 [Alyxoria varia]|nr:MAG: hypothetical protein M1831_004074 [Alyxoria varia]